MIFYSDKNVYEAAKERIRFIFEEFPDRNIAVSFSGGKDSTVVLHLVKEVLDEMGKNEKVKVFFCDQEVEAPQTIEYMRQVMHYPWVEPYWVQSYFQEWNASKGAWFNVWGPGEKWVREKEPDMPYGDLELEKLNPFSTVLDCMQRKLFGDNYIALGGVRVDESPARRLGLSYSEVYKGITWGATCAKGAYVFYPIWDWSTNDVWYYIFSHRYPYCKLYNYYFTHKPLPRCRVSSFIHENSIHSLKEIKEIAPAFYEKALRRVENINTSVQALSSLATYVGKLPPYFKDWREYVFYLADHIVEDPKNIDKFKKGYDRAIRKYAEMFGKDKEGMDFVEYTIGNTIACAIVSEDFTLSQVTNKGLTIIKYYHDNYERIKKANQE